MRWDTNIVSALGRENLNASNRQRKPCVVLIEAWYFRHGTDQGENKLGIPTPNTGDFFDARWKILRGAHPEAQGPQATLICRQAFMG
jgi:hypothetical protein